MSDPSKVIETGWGESLNKPGLSVWKASQLDLNALIAMGIESSFGTDSTAYNLDGSYIGPFQIGEDVAAKYPDIIKSKNDLLDADKSRQVYNLEVENLTKNDKSWKRWSVDERSKELLLPSGLVEWITWNQGRGGAIDIITTATHQTSGVYESGEGAVTSGMFTDSTGDETWHSPLVNPPFDVRLGTRRKNILSNLSGQAKRDGERAQNDQELARIYVQHWKEKWYDQNKVAEDRLGPGRLPW